MENKNTFIAIVASAILSSVCTATVMTLSDSSNTEELKDLSSIKSQIAQLKSELSLERQARESLELQSNAALKTSNKPASSQAKTTEAELSNTASEPSPTQGRGLDSRREELQRLREQRAAQRLARRQPEYRVQQLVSAGFAQEEAARIVQIESEQALKQLQAQYDSRREQAQSSDNTTSTNALRAELGDQNYERYLEANGLPTSAQVGAVIGGSPGANAGLKAGDRITSYASERVFSLNDINNLTVQGNVGESVLIEVERDGESVQLPIPRGPIGINGRRRR
jgi:C-terminal processing protease CtpA/Prc